MHCVHVDLYTDNKSLQYLFTKKDSNLRQTRWLELLKDYNMSVLYNPGKANVVEDALCHHNYCFTRGRIQERHREIYS